MYGAGQPIVIQQSAPRRTYRRKGPSKVFKKYKRAYWNAVRFKRAFAAKNPRGGPESIKFWGPDWANATPEQKAFRRALGFRGKGDYSSFFRKFIPDGSFASAGRFLGGLSGIPGATAVGAYAGNKLSKYVGFGDYGGDAGGNQIMAGSTATPLTVNASDDLTGDVYFSHREFVKNVTATGGAGNISAFSVESFPLNAGLSKAFPWLAQIAQNFTLYEFEGLMFEFRPTSGELGQTGTNALGKVVMATQYDPDAPAFSSTVEMENYDYANSCKPSEHMVHGIETAVAQRPTNLLYVRTGQSAKDKIFTDIGTYQLATEGIPITSGVTAILGELWVTYRVKLSRAKLFGTQLAQNIAVDNHIGVSSTANLYGNTASYLSSVTWGPEFLASPAPIFFPWVKNTLGCTVAQNTTNQSIKITFPDGVSFGVYRIVWEIVPSANSTISFNSPSYSGNAAAKIYNGWDGQPTAASITTAITASTGMVVQIATVAITAAPVTPGANYVILSFVAADASNNKLSSVSITQLPAL